MSVLVVGTTALDSIKTPYTENPRLLGGSASHAAVAASFFGPTRLVGVIGSDFPSRYIQLYKNGRLPVDRLMGERLTLDDINRGFDRLATGQSLRDVVIF